MSSPAPLPDPEPLNRALTRCHRAVLALLAVCALVIFIGGGEAGGSPDPPWTVAALVAAAASVILRRFGTSPVMNPRARVTLTLAGMGLAVVVGFIGVVVARVAGDTETGFIFVLGSGVISLIPPARITARAPADQQR